MINQKSDGRRSGKELLAEEERTKTIDVNDESSDDDFVDSAFNSGVRRSGRNKKGLMCESEKTTSVVAGIKGKGDIKGTKRSMETGSTSGVGKKRKKNNTKAVKNCVYNTSLTLQTRSSPKTFCNMVEYLKPNQKACLEEIGFGGMVDFRVDGIPGRMGVYVVHKFDENKMEMGLETGSISITKDKIGEMLGINNQGVDILEGTPVKNSEIFRLWTEQYEGATEVKPADVKWMIRKSDKADMKFKLNFIVLFATLMGIIPHKGVCDLTVLEYIKPDTNLASINWCDYIWRSLKACKEPWTMGKKNSYFRGPLTLLTMIYVDGTKSASKIVCRTRPPTKVWTAELLSDRETEDLKSGGFGKGQLEDEYVAEEPEPIPTDVDGCVWMLEEYVASIKNARVGFDRIIEAANNMFPGNVKLIGLAESYVNSLKYISGDNEVGIDAMMHLTTESLKDGQGQYSGDGENMNEDVNGEGYQEHIKEGLGVGVSDVGFKEKTPVSVKAVCNDSSVNIQTPESAKTLMVDTDMSSGFDRPDTVVGVLTQQAFVEVAEKVESSINKSSNNSKDFATLNEWGDVPTFSLNVTQDFDLTPVMNKGKQILTPDPISACKPGGEVLIFRGQRVKHKSQFERSPFSERVVDLTLPVTSEELQVYRYLFSKVLNSGDEVLFMEKSGQQSTRSQLENLGMQVVENNILDTWAAVRNYMEEFKNKDSPLRLFLPTFVVDKHNFGHSKNNDIRYNNFVKHVESVIGTNNDGTRLSKTDVVFLPVDNEGHRFVIVFDLKFGAVLVVDPKKHDKTATKQRVIKGGKKTNWLVAEMLHADFGKYVYSKNHFKAANMIKAELEFGRYEWQTATERPYAGLFLMRIMETNMGKGMPSWNLRINTARGTLQRDLAILTQKYVAKIILSKCNMLKDSFVANMKKDSCDVPNVPVMKENVKING